MNLSPEEYSRLADEKSPPSPSGKNYVNAFWIGGVICVIGELLTKFYEYICKLELLKARTATSATLIALAAALTALGLFHKIAKVAGAGTLVPITGFANSVVSPAIEFKPEGQVYGIGAKIFTIAGPVLCFGFSASVLYGLIYWLYTLIFGGGA